MAENRASMLIFAAFAILLALMAFVFSGISDRAIKASPIGSDGLFHWLNANEIEAVRSHRRTVLSEGDIALRVLPLLDTNLYSDAPEPFDARERLSNPTLRDLDWSIFDEKITYVSSLVILPKWRAGVLEHGLLDPQLLIPMGQMGSLLSQIGIEELTLTRNRPGFTQTDDGLTAYELQLFHYTRLDGLCTPVLSVPEGVLLARCALRDSTFHILSDPDILNTHGLALGNNAEVALGIIRSLMWEGVDTVYIDTSTTITLDVSGDEDRALRPRTADDLSRFLTYPFSLILMGAGAAFLIMLWRGLARFGPALQLADDGHAASTSASLEAKGYVLQMTGEDHALVQDYITARLHSLNRDIFGPKTRFDRGTLTKKLAALAPQTHADFAAALARVANVDATTPTAAIEDAAYEFDESYRRLSDELGHVSRGH